jgi:hypothetical protein
MREKSKCSSSPIRQPSAPRLARDLMSLLLELKAEREFKNNVPQVEKK